VPCATTSLTGRGRWAGAAGDDPNRILNTRRQPGLYGIMNPVLEKEQTGQQALPITKLDAAQIDCPTL